MTVLGVCWQVYNKVQVLLDHLERTPQAQLAAVLRAEHCRVASESEDAQVPPPWGCHHCAVSHAVAVHPPMPWPQAGYVVHGSLHSSSIQPRLCPE